MSFDNVLYVKIPEEITGGRDFFRYDIIMILTALPPNVVLTLF